MGTGEIHRFIDGRFSVALSGEGQFGSRQQGRLRAENILEVGYDADEITAAIEKCLWDEDFRSVCSSCENPYGSGDTGPKVAELVATISLDQKLIRKKLTY